MNKRIIPTLIRRYAEEASFLWIVRERAVRAPNRSQADIAVLDERLEAQLDGLRVAGDAGWEFCQGELAWEEAGEIFVGGVLALESPDPKRLETVAEAASVEPGLTRALIGSIAWFSREKIQSKLESLARSENPILRYAAIGGAAVQGAWMPDLMRATLNDSDSLVLARALKACGEFGRRELLPQVESHLGHSDEACCFWACWSSLLLGRQEAKFELLVYAKKPGPFRQKAMALALRAIPKNEALAWLDDLGESNIRLRILGLGWLGAVSRVPWLLQQMRIPALARPAGSALTWITGAEFQSGGLGVLPAPGLEDELDEQGLVESTDSDLNWPDPDRTESWWKETTKKYSPDFSYILGQAKNKAAFQNVLRDGKQSFRLGAALDLALLDIGKPLWECRSRVNGRKPNL